MAFVTAVLYLVDSDGNRIYATRSDGTKAPVVVKIGSGLDYTVETNGDVDVVEIAATPPDLDVVAGLGLNESPTNTLNVTPHADGSIVIDSNSVQVGVLATDAQHGDLGAGSLHELAVPTGEGEQAGFMSAADAALLADATELNTASTLVKRDATGYIAVGDLDCEALAADTLGADTSCTSPYYNTPTNVGTQSTSGVYRSCNNPSGGAVSCRGAGAYDVQALTVDGSDQVVLGEATNTAAVYASAKTGGYFGVKLNGAEVAQINATTLTFAKTVATPGVKQSDQTTDTAAFPLTIETQAPYASATGTNRDAKNIDIKIKPPAAGGARGKIRMMEDGVEIAYFDYQSGANREVRSADNFYVRGGGTVIAVQNLAGASGYVEVSGGSSIRIGDVNNSEVARFVTALSGANEIKYVETITSLKLWTATKTSDVAPVDTTIQTQAPYASATTDAKKKPGDLIFDLGAPTGSGAYGAQRQTKWGTKIKVIEVAHTKQTTDNTLTTLFTIPSIPDDCVLVCDLHVAAQEDATGDTLGAPVRAVYRRSNGGALVQVDADENAFAPSTAGASTWAAATTTSSNDLLVQGQGENAKTIDWGVVGRVTVFTGQA